MPAAPPTCALLDAALVYAARGWRVLPLFPLRLGLCTCRNGTDCRTPGKHPMMDDWPEKASTDAAQLTRWWGQRPTTNVGIATGAQSGIIVLDIDPRHGGDGALVELQALYAPLPDTPMVLTGGGGQHFYFACDEVLPGCSLHPGIQFQAEAHQVVAPPSLHASGQTYCWEASADIDDMPLAPLPAWLRALALSHHHTAGVAGVVLPAVLPALELHTLKVSARIKFLIQTGEDPENPSRYASRSEKVFAVLVALITAGHDDATIASVLLDRRYAISEKPLSQRSQRSPRWLDDTRQWLAKEIARARLKVRPTAPTMSPPTPAQNGLSPQEPATTRPSMTLNDLWNAPAVEWWSDTAMAVLSTIRSQPQAWGRTKAVAYTLRLFPPDLEHAVDTWMGGQGLTPPVPLARRQPRESPLAEAIQHAGENWRDSLIVTAKGTPTECASNIGLILAHHDHWHGRCWWDSVRSIPMLGDEPLSDKLLTDIAQWLGLEERMPVKGLRLIEHCLIALCQDTPRDLLQEWLAALPPWDQVPRLDAWLSDCAGTELTAYGQFVSRILPVSMVVRALEPGCLYRYVVILEGLEEWKKSTLVWALASEMWCLEMSSGLETKEAHMLLSGVWVAELPELDSLSRTEETRLKAFITMRADSYIPKYSNNRVSHPRRAIFIGTTNEQSYLKGQTGNTRFLPIKVQQEVRIDDFLTIRTQLFAEALAFAHAHPSDWWQMPAAAKGEAAEHRNQRRLSSVYEEDLDVWLDVRRVQESISDPGRELPTPGETSWPEIARWYLRLDTPEKWKDPNLQRQITAALKSLGWEQRVVKDAQRRSSRRWFKMPTPLS